jgi:hypothetical protein
VDASRARRVQECWGVDGQGPRRSDRLLNVGRRSLEEASRRPVTSHPEGTRAKHVHRSRRDRRHGGGGVGRPLSPEGPSRTPRGHQVRRGVGPARWGSMDAQDGVGHGRSESGAAVRKNPRVPKGLFSCVQGGVFMSRQMFVWRMARDHSVGDPCDHTPGKGDSSRVHREIRKTGQVDIDYTGAVAYVFDELSHSRLRYGWGVVNPDLDLMLEEHTWIENYIMACHKYWSLDLDALHAMGRRKVLCCMLDMHESDVIFLPKRPDDGHFMVATVKSRYCFDRHTVAEESDLKNDFRHVIAVKDIMRYAYGWGTLQPGIFEAPFREGIQRIQGHDSSYRAVEDFLLSWGR